MLDGLSLEFFASAVVCFFLLQVVLLLVSSVITGIYYTGLSILFYSTMQIQIRLLLVSTLFFGLSFAAAGHDHDHDHDDDHDCSSTTFATAEEFGQCLDIVVHDFEEEREKGFTFIPSDFNATSLFYLNFSSTAVSVTVCNCDFPFDARTVYASPDPHLNTAVSAVYLRSQPTATFLHGAGVTSPTPMPGKYALVMVDASDGAPNGSPARPGLHWLVRSGRWQDSLDLLLINCFRYTTLTEAI